MANQTAMSDFWREEIELGHSWHSTDSPKYNITDGTRQQRAKIWSVTKHIRKEPK